MGTDSFPDKSHRQTVFVSEHHLKEVRKHWEKLVIEYADKPYRTDTSQPVACVTNDAINLARGIQAAPSATAPKFLAVGYVNTLKGCTSTKYEPGRLPDGERMLYISVGSTDGKADA